MSEIAQPADGLVPPAPKVRWRWSAADTVIAVAASLIVVVFAIFGLLCWQGYYTTLQSAKTKAQSAAQIVAEDGRWMLGSAHAVLQQVAGIAEMPADITAEQAARVKAAIASLPVEATLGLYDATGAAFADGRNAHLGDAVGEDDFFKALEGGGDWTISPQRPDAAGGSPVFVVAQRLGTEQFGGVALLTISVDVLQRFWEPLNLGKESTISLIRDDGWLIARYPALPETMQLNTAAPFTSLAGQDVGAYESARSPVDGIARVVAFSRIPQVGTLALASISQDAVLAGLWSAIATVLWLMGPIGIALFVGSLLTARLLRQSARTQASLAAAVAHNNVLFREIHHRVKNNLQSVGSLLQMQPIPREIKINMGQRIAAMSAVHEHIYRSNDFSTVRVKDYLQTLIENIRAGSAPQVRVVEQLEDLPVDKDAATPLGLILNEVVANAFKHAFPDGREGVITVSLARSGESDGLLTVEDNGVGFDPAVPAKGIGRRLIAALTAQLGGQFAFTSVDGSGSRFTLSFPLAKP